MRERTARFAVLSAAVATVFGTGAGPAVAADTYWQGTSNNDWTNVFNWLGFTPPTSSDTVKFSSSDSGGFPPIRSGVNLDNANRTVATMIVYGDTPVGAYTFTRTGNCVLTVTGRTSFGFTGGAASTTTFNGFALDTNVFTTFVAATVNLTNSSVVNTSGAAFVQDSSTLNVTGSTLTCPAFFTNGSGRLNVSGGGVVTTNGTSTAAIQGSSVVTLGSGGTLNAGNHLLINGGELVVQPGSGLTIASGRVLLAQGATSKITFNRSFAVSNGAALQANTGGDIVASSYVDIGNGNAADLGIDGVGTTFTTAGTTASDWGAGNSGQFNGQIINGAVANISTLHMGTSNATAALSLNGGGSLTTGNFVMGGGASVRNVNMAVNDGSFIANGNASFDNRAVVNLQAGNVQFNADATFNAGSTLNQTGGTVTSSGVYLNIAGGAYSRNALGTELSNGSALRVTAGGQSTGTSYYDIANSNTTATLLVDGSGSLFTAGGLSVSDWGRNAGHTATVTLSNSAQANFNGLRIGSNNGAANVSVASNAVLTTAGTLAIGGGTTARAVNVTIAGGTLTTNGTTTLDNQAILNLSSGTINFNSDATVLAGGTLNRTGGTLTIATGKKLDINGGTFNRNGTNYELSNGATLRLLAGGQSPGTNFFDIANAFGTTGTLVVDGSGTLFTVGDLSDWGRGVGKSASVAITNSGQVNLTSTTGALRFGTENAASSVLVSAAATLNSAGTITAGGGTTARTVKLDVLGGTLTTSGLATFDNRAVVNLGTSGSGGAINFNGGATLLSGSTLNWASGNLGVAAGKTLTVSGGTLTQSVAGIYQNPDTTLTVNNGGTLTASNFFDIQNGTLNVAGAGSSLTVNASSNSDWTYYATDVATVGITGGGTATYYGGLHMGTNGNGTVNLTVNTGGRLNTSDLVAGSGAVSVAVNNPSAVTPAISVSGTSQLRNNLTITLTSGRIALGQLSMSGNAKIVPSAANNTGVMAVSSLDMSDTSKIDVASGRLEVNYTGTSPLATIRALIGTGHNGGNWLGNRITSSAAAASASTTGLYYGGTTTQINVKLALYGDADGDGGVSINDFNALAGSFGQTSKYWTQGDFDYDGGVSINDFNRLAGNFGKTLASPSDGPNFAALALWAFAVAHHDEAGFIAATGVPEPAALTVLAAGVAGLRRRRR